MNDKELGFKILKSFHDSSRSYYPFATIYSLDSLVKTLEGRLGQRNFVEGLGLAARLAEMSDSKINSSMKGLARASNGKIPAKNGMFYSYMVDAATAVSFVDAVTYTAKESAKDIVKGAQAVGDQVLLTGKILNFLLPAIVLYLVYVYVVKKTA